MNMSGCSLELLSRVRKSESVRVGALMRGGSEGETRPGANEVSPDNLEIQDLQNGGLSSPGIGRKIL